MPRSPVAGLIAAMFLGGVAPPTFGAPAPKVTRADFAAIFQRDPVAAATLARDGRHLAYVIRERNADSLYIVDVDDPSRRKSIRVTGNRFLAWTETGQLMYAPPQEIRLVAADGTSDRKVVDANDVARYVPIGPIGGDGVSVEPRVPVVIGLVAGKPATIVVSATGRMQQFSGTGGETTVVTTPIDFYRIDALTGNKERIAARDFEGRGFADRQGTVRLFRNAEQELRVIKVGPRGSPGVIIRSWVNVPQTYELKKPDSMSWTAIDGLLDPDTGFRFLTPPGSYFGERTIPIGFGTDSNRLYVASNVGRDKYGIYSLNLQTFRRSDFALENPVFDLAGPDDAFGGNVLVFDRSGDLVGIDAPGLKRRWFVPALAQLQSRLDDLFGGRDVKVVDWSLNGDRALFLASSPTDPGRYFVFDAKSGEYSEFLRRSGEIDLRKMGTAERFEFDAPSGVHLTGTLTQPKSPVINPPPLVLYCPDFPSARPADGFNPDAQALAAIGFVVAEVNHRGMLGFGQQHLRAALDGLDRIPLEDLRATVDWIAARQKIDRTRIAIVGEGMGGFVAIRALELYPDEFRCAVCINAVTNPGDWIHASKPNGVRGSEVTERLAEFLRQVPNIGRYSASAEAKNITKPVLILQETGWAAIPERQGQSLRDAIRGARGDVEYQTLNSGFRNRDPAARAAAYVEIADFMRSSLYDYNVKIGPVRPVSP